ncbi:hypothetical protein HY008_00210 [Candidatus Woesebacteria bacterium]|nr:hypothetical protein [Candidatus Woesebacteria bacterium]
MTGQFGAILLQQNRITAHIYAVDEHGYILLFQSCLKGTSSRIIKTIADIMQTAENFSVLEWKICALGISKRISNKVAEATGLSIDIINKQRGRELILKGMVTEIFM